jgi:hypothetical protein
LVPIRATAPTPLPLHCTETRATGFDARSALAAEMLIAPFRHPDELIKGVARFECFMVRFD